MRLGGKEKVVEVKRCEECRSDRERGGRGRNE